MVHKSSHEVYIDAIERMEPDITAVDHAGAICSIAISLKRIADALENLPPQISMSISEGLFNAERRR